MSVTTVRPVERPAVLFGVEDRDRAGGEPTLDDAVVAAWEGLAARSAVACPLCGGGMRPRAAGGRCEDCGTSLS
jgi:hypothetical protein